MLSRQVLIKFLQSWSKQEVIVYTLHSKTCVLECIVWNKEELPGQWKESAIVLVYKKGDKTNSSNYDGISFLSPSR
jgi:hypothetical protein